MKTIILIVLTGILTAVTEYYVNWQMIVVIPFIVSLIIGDKPRLSFWGGFIGIFLFWTITMFAIDIPNRHILSSKMGKLFHLNDYFVFIPVIGILGGLLGGLSSMSAAYIRSK